MNSDEIGAQAPVIRSGDPHEALAALEDAVPGLRALRRGTAGRVDWAVVERGLGTALPGDFKLLAESYPPLLFGDYLSFWTPAPGAEEAWVKATAEEREDVADLLDIEDLGGVLAVYPEPGGLLVWGGSNEGDTFMWTTTGTGPEAWKVTVGSHSGDWWHYDAGAGQFTADLISGALQPWGLPRVRPEVVAVGGGTGGEA